RPDAPSDALTSRDLALLDEWVRRGGVVVLGYDGDGEGYLDRWTANRWLEYEGAGISIGDRVLEDTTTRTLTTGRAQPWALARPVGDEPLGSVYEPFPLDRNHVVVARSPTQLLAITSQQAFVRPPKDPADRPGAGRRDQPPRPRDARAAVPPVDHTVLGRGRARRHACLPHGGGTLDAAPRRVGARAAGGARRAARAEAGALPRGAAVTAARASRRSEHHRAAARPGQEARAGHERARLAAPAAAAA